LAVPGAERAVRKPNVESRKPKMVPNPHDALFKTVFSDPAMAAAELRAVLPPAIAARMEFDTLRLESGALVARELGDRHADLLFSVRLAGRVALVFVLLEHQSEPDALSPLRLMRYMVLVWERWLAAHPKATRLPPIIPVVVSHAEGGWRAPRSMDELYDLSEADLATFGRWLPRFDLVLDDLAAQDEAALRARTMDVYARLALLLLRDTRAAPDEDALIVALADLLRELEDDPAREAARATVMSYILLVRRVDRVRMAQRLRTLVGPRMQEAVMTTGEELMREGEQRGLERGLQRGRAEGVQTGLQKGLQQTLLRLLGHRFGRLDRKVVARVRAARPEQLQLWLERILTAETVEAVLGA